jgi:hypothetical protein
MAEANCTGYQDSDVIGGHGKNHGTVLKSELGLPRIQYPKLMFQMGRAVLYVIHGAAAKALTEKLSGENVYWWFTKHE